MRGAMESSALQEHVEKGLRHQQIEDSYTINVPTVTFAEVLDKASLGRIDFLFLDLEGYEIEALRG